MRSSGVHGLLIYCSDYRCSHYIAISGDRWPDDVGCLILSRSSPARPAADAVPTCGPTSIGISRAPLVRLCWSFVPDDLSAFASKKPNG